VSSETQTLASINLKAALEVSDDGRVRALHHKARFLAQAVDLILDDIEEDQRRELGSVNWSDLRCVGASLCFAGDGHTYWSALIEEASPESNLLSIYVHEQLKLRFGVVVDINTEW
jgi:hypothetical protein